MKRNRKLIIGIIVAIGFTGIFIIYILSPLTEKGWTKKLFAIDESKYELVFREDQLSKFEYGGSYTIKIRVREEQMDSFISDIQSAPMYLLSEDEEVDPKAYNVVVKNITGEDMDSNSKLYIYEGALKRKIQLPLAEPKTVMSSVYYSESVDGVYEVYLSYAE